MVEIRTIAVMGATGRQGRGVVDALLFNKGDIEYQVRPLTSSLTSKLAQRFSYDYPQLTLMQWDMNNTSSLQKCFEGCHGAFIDSGILLSPESSLKEWTRAELALGDLCRQAAEKANIKHLVYPTFPSIFNASNGRINIRHFETKHQITLQLQASSIPSTILCPGPFYTDFNDMDFATRDGDVVVFSTPAAPTKRMGWADPGHDIGWFARAALDAGRTSKEELVPVCGQSISYEDLATMFTTVTGIKAVYRQCSVEEFGTRGGVAGVERVKGKEVRGLGEWLAIAPDERTCYGTIGMEQLELVEREMGVKALSWEKFLERTGWRGPTFS
ncbi:uncharacterized protein PAC_19333 [Phialocephala subalpina]|uniref:NmrA-like domain-containing protein n=1 Tax=Phialocephala subalpina TaxID=576137 RepID=A0A1L7XWK8_9HELO|nr:uncharacterized protein PAC_19333 [Phialocephala subalpina]